MIPKPKYSPCYKCQERHPGCHGECEKYKKWKQGVDEYSGAKRNHYSDAVNGYITDLNTRVERQARAKGKK